MTVEPRPPARDHQERGAVARLAEALAAAQATANDELVDEASVATSERPGDPQALSLFDRLAHLPGDADPSDVDDRSAPDGQSIADRSTRLPKPAAGGGSLRPLYALMVILVLAVPVLGFIGYRSVGGNTRGQVLSGHARPDAPGYQALVEPTPVSLVTVVDDDGSPLGITLLSLSGPNQKGGAVVSIPVGTRLAKPIYRLRTYGDVIRQSSTETSAAAIAGDLGLGFTEAIELDPAKLASFLKPVGAITLDNPMNVKAPDGKSFAKGKIELAPDEVADYLAANDAEGSEITRLQRAQLFWTAWLAAVRDAGGRRGVVPGEVDAGLGRFVRGLAAGQVAEAVLPTVPADPLDGKETFATDRGPSRLLLTNAVPFPTAGSPGDRATAKVLNGTGPGAIPPSVLQRIAYAGIQMTMIGNAPRFDVARTTVTYSDPAVRPFVMLLAGVLGPVRVVHAQSGEDNTDVTIVIGKDLMADPPGALTLDEIGR